MKEDNFLLGQIEDKITQCEKQIYRNTYWIFWTVISNRWPGVYCRKAHIPVFDEEPAHENFPPTRSIFYGGYEDAERVVLISLPDYAALEDYDPLTVIRAVKADGSRELTHRDYLGSLVGLGIRRELLGDILVREDGADIIALADIAEFIFDELLQGGTDQSLLVAAHHQ